MIRKVLSISLSILLLTTPFANVGLAIQNENIHTQAITNQEMPLVFTEVYPNDKANPHIEGAGDNDLFEFIEIYNQTDEQVDFNQHYKIRYDYITNQKDLIVSGTNQAENSEIIIPPNSSAVLWVERTSSKITGAAANLSEQDFREYHNIPESVPVYMLKGQDGLNNSDRGFYITSKHDNNQIISHIHYTAEDVGDGLSFHTKVANDHTTVASFLKKAKPSAGVVLSEQLQSVINEEPTITHQQIQEIKQGNDLQIQATISDKNLDPLTAKLSYKVNDNEFKTVDLTEGTDGLYTYTIPSTELNGDTLQYYFEVSDSKVLKKSETFTVKIVPSEQPEQPDNPELPEVPQEPQEPEQPDQPQEPEQPEQPELDEKFPIMITEVYPNDKSNSHINGAGENDLFEFIEIYNASENDLDFNSTYNLRYNYVSNTKQLKVTAVDDATNENVIIPAKSSAVLWIERTSTGITGDAASLTEADFRKYHNIPENIHVYMARGQDGLANNDRGFLITDKLNNTTMSEVFYTSDDVSDGKSLQTRVPKTGTLLDALYKKSAPTPGIILDEQLVPTTNKEPVITHSPVSVINRSENLTIMSSVDDADSDPLTVSLFYRFNSYSEFTEVLMEMGENGQYHYTVPSEQFVSSPIEYFIEANDQESSVTSDHFHVKIEGFEEKEETPNILITELAPNPSGDYRKGSGNQYEFLEIYNNSDEVLNLKGYTLFYLYPNNSPLPKKWTITQDTSIEPYSTAVIWFAKEAIRDGYTTAHDFNIHYNSSLNEDDVIIYDNTASTEFNLPNSLHRGFAISSSDSVNDIVVEAWYDASNVDSADRLINDVRNSAVVYRYPEKGKTMERIETRDFSNPGSIDEGQVPSVANLDVVSPMIEHDQPFYTLKQNTATVITMTSHEKLENAEFIYGTAENELTEFTNRVKMELKEEQNNRYVYEATITISELGSYRYMLVGEDASGNLTKVPYNSRGNSFSVIEQGQEQQIPTSGLSIKNGEVINQTVDLFAYGKNATDDIMVSFQNEILEMTPALPGNVQLGFQARGIDHIYQTSASAINSYGEREYFTRIYPKYLEGAMYTYEMAPTYFIKDSLVSIHAGSENVPYDLDVHEEHFNKTNFDDLEVMNLHLVLPDGKMIKPVKIHNYLGNLTQSELAYSENIYYPLGDGNAPTNTNLTKPLKRDFIFDLPEDALTARYTAFDTTKYADGTYQLNVKVNATKTESINITVDNTNPEIKGIKNNGKQIEEGDLLKGHLTFTVEAADNLSGISKIEAELDGEAIELPYKTSSANLAPGNHELTVTAFDGAGNKETVSTNFVIETELPEDPTDLSPNNFGTEISRTATLKAKVIDPSGDKMDVTFLEGDKYDFAREDGISGFSNVADREPPLTLTSEGETTLTDADKTKIAYEDGNYLVNDSTMGFPYHRFEVEVSEQLSEKDTVELYWKGKTLPNRIVTLYGWDNDLNKWVALKSATGDTNESDIVLSVEIDKNKFVKDGKIQAMVQDEIKNPNDPFTMLWWTDTQYYAESYPHIFDSLGDWIVDEYNNGLFDYAIHTGDLVNVANSDEQWLVADRNLKKLDDAKVPYGVLAGNHDSIIDGIDYSYYHKYVGADRFENNPWYGGSMDNNRNHYDLMSFGGHDFIILYLGFGTEDTPETIAWANEVLQKHADRNAIIGMHAYLEYNATLSNMSQNVFDKIIVPNENVKMVIGGHYHGVTKRISKIPNKDGTTREVLEMLADYQGGPNGGDGYVRLLTFDPIAGKVDIKTYSPILDDYDFFAPEDESFTENFTFNDINKRVATDYFSVNIYSEKTIGTDKDVASGDFATTEWKNLEPNKTYYWYMNITDEYGATRKSDIYRFTTSDVTPPDNQDGDDHDDGGDNNNGGNDNDNDGNNDDDGQDNDGNNNNGGNDHDNNGNGDKNPLDKDNNNNGSGNNNGNNGKDNDNPKDDVKGNNDEKPNKNGASHSNTSSLTNDKVTGIQLPNTATDYYTILLAGAILIIIGLAIYSIMRKRARA